MSEFFRVESVTKEYQSGQETVRALKGVSALLHPGDYLAIVGPSGAGKSTLLHTLGGLDLPTQGRVLFKGRDIYKMKDKELSLWRNKHIGFVFQFYHLIEELNAFENITLSLDLNKRKYSLKTIEELLKYLGVGDKKKAFPSQLSGGQRQRVAFARALANDPEVILCDEPTGNLDKESQEKIVALLDKLNKEKGKAIVLVTHNLELAKHAQRSLFIKDGYINGG
jgi:putative ABC transport system ATP-binding protein